MSCDSKRPWIDIPIIDCGEKLDQLKPSFHCLEPHPYLSIGAPYDQISDPWRLRTGVIRRLFLAQKYLQNENPNFSLAIFDAWRPISVQAFMIDHSIDELCLARGFDRNDQKHAFEFSEAVKEVNRFWAPAILDPCNPPPHSTGAAVDLTLADSQGNPFGMGGEIDEISPVSHPNYYVEDSMIDCACQLWHQRRISLAKAMEKAGFIQHPHEWWHFSYGDQLWAWRNGSSQAFYGSCLPPVSKERTATSPKSSMC